MKRWLWVQRADQVTAWTDHAPGRDDWSPVPRSSMLVGGSRHREWVGGTLALSELLDAFGVDVRAVTVDRDDPTGVAALWDVAVVDRSKRNARLWD